MADDTIEVEVKPNIDEKGFAAALQRISNKIQKFGNSPTLKSLSNIGASISGVGAAYKIITDSVNALKSAISEMSELYNKQTSAEVALAQAAKNNPYLLSTSVTKLKNYASELQSISTYGDEELLPFMAQLASAGRTEQEIMDIMSASIDVAASGSMSLDSAVKNLNKTFSGLSGELGEVNPQVKALSAEELKNGKAVEVLKSQYKGMAQEVAKATGTSQQLQNAIGDLKEELGAPFEKAMSPIRAFFTELIGGWASAKKAKREYEEAGKLNAKSETRTADTLNTQIEGLKKEIEQREKEFADMTDPKKMQEKVNTGRGYVSMDMLKTANENYRKRTEEMKDLLKRRLRQLDQAVLQEKKAADAQKKAQEEADAKIKLESEIEARDKLRDAYDETIRQKQEEINLRRITGEEISNEAEAQEMYNTALSAYIKMMSDPAFKGNSGNFDHEKNARSDIAGWGKIKDKGELTEQIKEFEDELQQVADKANGIVKNEYDDVLKMLDAQYAAIIENKEMEINEKLRLEQEYETKRKEIEAARAKDENDAFTERINALMGGNQSYWDTYKAKIAELQQIEDEVSASTVLSTEEKEAQKTAIVEAAVQARKELIASIASDVQNYTSQAVSIMQDACNLMLETSKNEATAEQAELETKYRKGEISEEEYNKKVAESKKKAAKEQYKIQMWQWGASILQATANIAQGVSMAIAQGGVAGLITGALVGAAGAVQIASIIASKPTPPSFSTGGIIGGTSTHGDNIAANLNSREMVMNMNLQKALWDFINGGSKGAGGGTNIVINNSASNLVTAQPQISKDKIELLIDARVNDSLKNGRYTNALNMAQQGAAGDYYGI
jgi:hypothetical protein